MDLGPSEDAERQDPEMLQEAELALLRGELRTLRHELIESERRLSGLPGLEAQVRELLELVKDLERDRERALEREGELARVEASYRAVVSSRSWRLTAPLRHAGDSLRRPSS